MFNVSNKETLEAGGNENGHAVPMKKRQQKPQGSQSVPKDLYRSLQAVVMEIETYERWIGAVHEMDLKDRESNQYSRSVKAMA